jgi:hypothetical protein
VYVNISLAYILSSDRAVFEGASKLTKYGQTMILFICVGYKITDKMAALIFYGT